MSTAIADSQFARYAQRLRALNETVLKHGGLPFPHVDEAAAHLDGLANRELQATVARADLRRLGAFFTGEALANQAVEMCQTPLPTKTVADPACGCGDLLIAAARQMEICDSLEETLRRWGGTLRGVDCVPEFVDVARQRLMLLAVQRGARVGGASLPPLEALFPQIVVGDGLNHHFLSEADIVVANPPYGKVSCPEGTPWGTGMMTAASIWAMAIGKKVRPHTEVVAVLPDVLRSGSRYEKWRKEIGELLIVNEVRVIGQFDALTDVDVFLLRGHKKEQRSSSSWPKLTEPWQTLDSLCSVSVGSVVDRRDPHAGPWVPYITTRELPRSGEFRPSRKRRFGQKLFRPPFVLIRRTSRPSDGRQRLSPVLVRGPQPVAVENHLIVLQPKGRTIKEANRLIELLEDPRTTEWLNVRIRTRHLTVSAVREIPVNRSTDADLAREP